MRYTNYDTAPPRLLHDKIDNDQDKLAVTNVPDKKIKSKFVDGLCPKYHSLAECVLNYYIRKLVSRCLASCKLRIRNVSLDEDKVEE